MDKPPAMPVYARHWLADARVCLMSLEEQGAFHRLLCVAWMEDGIPTDGKLRARLLNVSAAKERKLWLAVGPCWEERNGVLVSPKQEKVRAELSGFQARQSNAGKKGAAARWARTSAYAIALAGAGLVAMCGAQRSEWLPSPSPSPVPRPEGESNDYSRRTDPGSAHPPVAETHSLGGKSFEGRRVR